MNKNIIDIPIEIIKKGSKKYPQELLDLTDPPLELRVRGCFDPAIFSNAIAVVGSRKMTRYGRDLVETFVTALSVRNIVIISGFMYGVDTAAHQTAIEAGGITIAVLAHGLNYIYPPENHELYQLILKSGGCLISEYPDNFKPQLWTYPKRNRIVAALSKKGTLVIEAAEQSGSLITASYADALNRPLFASPGSVFSKTSEGTNRLIKDNIAQMVLSIDDIIPNFSSKDERNPSLFEDTNKDEKTLLEALSYEEMNIDEISMKVSRTVTEIGTTLTMLSLRGIVEELNGVYRIRVLKKK